MKNLVKKNAITILTGLLLVAMITLGGCSLSNLGQTVARAFGGCCNFDVWSLGI